MMHRLFEIALVQLDLRLPSQTIVREVERILESLRGEFATIFEVACRGIRARSHHGFAQHVCCPCRSILSLLRRKPQERAPFFSGHLIILISESRGALEIE